MSSLKVSYNSKEFSLSSSIVYPEFMLYLNSELQIKNPLIKYTDEDNEVVTAKNQLEIEEALRFSAESNATLMVEEFTLDSAKESKCYEDKSCGVVNVETPSQTKDIELLDQSSEIKVNCSEVGSEAKDDFVFLAISSQIPKLEMHSKIIGVEYSDKSTNSIKEVSSKASEVMFEVPEVNFNLENLRVFVSQEINSKRFDTHNVECSECFCRPIRGIRYKCVVCPIYNLCGECEAKTEHCHCLLKLKKQEEEGLYESTLKKILGLGFSDLDRIYQAIEKHSGKYTEIVEELLELNEEIDN